MWNYFNPFILPFTLVAVLISIGALSYFFMGINLLATGYREKDRFKKQGGWHALFISILIITGVMYCYFKWVWFDWEDLLKK